MVQPVQIANLNLQNLDHDSLDSYRPILVAKKSSDRRLSRRTSIQRRVDSKETTILLPLLNDDYLNLRDFSQLQTTRPGSINNLKEGVSYLQGPNTARNSILANADLQIFPKRFQSPSQISFLFPKTVSQNTHQKPIYERIFVDTSQDFTSPTFLNKLKRLFPKGQLKENKTMTNQGGVCRYVSTKNAQRILRWLEDDLRFHRKPKINPIPGSQTEIDLTAHFNEQYMLIECLDSAITDILNTCEIATLDAKVKHRLDEHLLEILKISKQSFNSELILYSYYLLAQTAMARSDFKEAIVNLKNYKDMCTTHKLFQNKIYAYRNLGKCYQDLKKYKVALTYFTKYLQMAWFLDSSKDETAAYDFIGKQYYYLGIADKAAYYHQLMTSGKLEPKNSRLREVGVKKIAMNKDLKQKEASSKFYFLEKEEVIDEEDKEVSSIDEVVDLPHSVQDPRRKPPEKQQPDGNPPVLNLKEINKKKMERFISGLCKVELARKIHSQSPNKIHEYNEDGEKVPIKLLKVRTQSLPKLNSTKVLPKLKILRKKNPNDQVIVSHLSRNRHIKNFNLMGNNGVDHHLPETEQPISLEKIGPYEALKIRRILGKFKTNIKLVKESLEVCRVQNEAPLKKVIFPIKKKKNILRNN